MSLRSTSFDEIVPKSTRGLVQYGPWESMFRNSGISGICHIWSHKGSDRTNHRSASIFAPPKHLNTLLLKTNKKIKGGHGMLNSIQKPLLGLGLSRIGKVTWGEIDDNFLTINTNKESTCDYLKMVHSLLHKRGG